MSKLQHLLTVMHQDACMRENVPQKRKLKSGLRISLTCHSQGCTLTISRDQTCPSAKEYENCCNHFPYYVGAVYPVKIIDAEGRMALTGELLSQKQVAEKMKYIPLQH